MCSWHLIFMSKCD